MKGVTAIFNTTLGRKYLMAISGALLFGFVIAHMIGNLQIFLGPEAINRYGHFLQSTPEILWPSRIGLLALLVVHLMAAATLIDQNREARPATYAVNRPVDSTIASRTMAVSGLIVLIFVIYHLLHYTVQVTPINGTGINFGELHDDHGRHDVYRMMVNGFSNRWVAGFYVLGVGLLCFHLSHGVSAMFQSLGLKNGAYEALIDKTAKIAAVVLFLGYISIPIAVTVGLVK